MIVFLNFQYKYMSKIYSFFIELRYEGWEGHHV